VQGILDEVTRRAARISPRDPDGARKHYFYAAAQVVLAGLLAFAETQRAAVVARAARAKDRRRKRELHALAAMLAHVPRHPARTFHEALQSVWLVQFALALADDVSCSGRPDRYLLPFYQRDMANGTLTRDRAAQLLREFFWRTNEVFDRWPETIMLGGTDAQGRPVLNDLTRLFLETIEAVGMVNPNVGFCYRADTPDEVLDAALDKIAKGFSHPSLYNDRVITDGLRIAGVRPADACNYINSTCVEITPIGTSNAQVMLAYVHAAVALTALLNGGALPVADPELERQLGKECLAAWHAPAPAGLRVDLRRVRTFAGFYAAYKRALARVLHDTLMPAIAEEYRRAQYGSCPLVSCFTHDCIARGADVANGGARYHYCGVDVAGFATTVDALLAIRTAVFERRLVTLPTLAAALAADFSGHEPLRHFLRSCCPKYGMDDCAADAVAKDLYDFMRAELGKYRTSLGGRFYLGVFSGWGGGKRGWAAHVRAGHYAGATPDGRRAGMPLSENIGPAPGSDRNGLTALINSVTCMDHRHGLGGISVNWRISKALLTQASDRRKLRWLIREFMRKGGFELQLNVLDTHTLRKAQEEPEQFRSLMVRVAGYSDYFTAMTRAQQEEIIARTEHG
jgi:formate C-acetyltransferase